MHTGVAVTVAYKTAFINMLKNTSMFHVMDVSFCSGCKALRGNTDRWHHFNTHSMSALCCSPAKGRRLFSSTLTALAAPFSVTIQHHHTGVMLLHLHDRKKLSAKLNVFLSEFCCELEAGQKLTDAS